MRNSGQFKTARSTAVAGLVMVATACADTITPTGPTLRSEPVLAASSGGVVIKSMIGLEPLLDATQNLSQARGISDLGQVVGTTATNTIVSIREHGAIWEGSVFPTDLGTLAGDMMSSADAIKSDGSVIVGTSTGLSSQRPVRWVKINGAWVIDQLSMPADADHCYLVDIASDGTIAGTCYAIGTPPQITLWRNGVPVELGEGVPAAVNALGQVVVDVSGQALVWDTRTNPVTATPLGSLGGGSTFGNDINDLGEVVGSSRNAAGQTRPFLWSAKKGMIDLGTLPGAPSGSAQGINNLSQIVGGSAQSGSPLNRAVLWSKGKVIDLGVLAGYDISNAPAINAKNQIAGFSFASTLVNTMRATVWTVK